MPSHRRLIETFAADLRDLLAELSESLRRHGGGISREPDAVLRELADLADGVEEQVLWAEIFGADAEDDDIEDTTPVEVAPGAPQEVP